jgi:NAD(P)-dependent dehydrogenase (short-subunit alcohol dehydrogenase family)
MTGNCVLVTGATGGIGVQVCRLLAHRGLSPVIAYRLAREMEARDLAAATGGRPLLLDLLQPESIDRAIDAVANISLAGIAHCASPRPKLSAFGRIDEADMDLFWRANVIGPHRLFAGIIKACFRPKKAGTLVAVLSAAMGGAGNSAMAGMGAYTISKYGLQGVLALMAAEFKWLRVETVNPGYVETAMLKAFDERFVSDMRQKQPFLAPSDVAEQIVTCFQR